MEALKSYFSIVEPHLLNQVSGKPKVFIQLLQEREFLSEDAFAKVICGAKHPRKYYRNLKSRTIKILQALAIISTPKGENTVKKKYDFCQKNFAVGQKFINKGHRKEGLRLIKQAYRVAVAFDFVHLACELSSILYRNHVYYQRNRRQATFYANQVKNYIRDYAAEKQAEDYYYQMLQQPTRASQLVKAQEAMRGMRELQGASLRCKMFENTIKVYAGLNSGDYGLVIQSCNEALLFFEGKKGIYSSYYQFFFAKRGIAHMAMANYAAATDSFNQAVPYAVLRSYNDYLLRFYHTLNALHAGQYQAAYKQFQKGRKCRIESIRKPFAIIEAYFCFLTYRGYLPLHKPFRLGKYLNETFKAQQDKQGDNIAILIAELLVYLARDRGKFIDRIEAVKHYSYRHLKEKEFQRAKAFIKILCVMPRANFHPVALRRLAKKPIEYLRTHPLQLGENFEVEIIPFDDLLTMVLEQLQRKVA